MAKEFVALVGTAMEFFAKINLSDGAMIHRWLILQSNYLIDIHTP